MTHPLRGGDITVGRNEVLWGTGQTARGQEGLAHPREASRGEFSLTLENCDISYGTGRTCQAAKRKPESRQQEGRG